VNLFRFQYTNHLGSAHLECDQNGAVISYEELHPYGSSAYRSVASGVEVSARRYRYTGKERDEETGMDYFGARFYAPWLGRWTTADPLGLQAGVNLYLYARGSPVVMVDPNGMQEEEWSIGGLVERGVQALPGGGSSGEGGANLSGDAPPPMPSLQDLMDEAIEYHEGGPSADEAHVEKLNEPFSEEFLEPMLAPVPEPQPGDMFVNPGDPVGSEHQRLSAGEAMAEIHGFGQPAVDSVTGTFYGGASAARAVLPLVGAAVRAALGGSATAAQAGPGGLVHLTTPATRTKIVSEGLLQGRSGIYAGPAANAELKGIDITLRTGLSPSQAGAAVRIPSGAEAMFSRPIPIGPMTAWQRLTGQRFTAAGNLDLATGIFVRTGVNWNQAGIYAVDATATSAVVGGSAVYFGQ
jgi:RHS repeat-associated protein